MRPGRVAGEPAGSPEGARRRTASAAARRGPAGETGFPPRDRAAGEGGRVTLALTTAGESHGPALVAILTGLPAGLTLDRAAIDADLHRRQQGYGRSPRQQLEQDEVEVLAGLRHGRTLGNTARARRAEPRSPELGVGDESVAAGGRAVGEGDEAGDTTPARPRRPRRCPQVRPRRRSRRARACERAPHRRLRRRRIRRKDAAAAARDRGRGFGARDRRRARGLGGSDRRGPRRPGHARGRRRGPRRAASSRASAPMRRARTGSTPAWRPR